MFVTGKPKTWLRLEGIILFIATLILFSQTNQKWWLFITLLFLPDIFMIGYIRNTKWGAFIYNLGHSYLAPFTLIFISWLNKSQLGIAIGIIWLAHIGMDRGLGYGLKYDQSFKTTHLGSLEKPK